MNNVATNFHDEESYQCHINFIFGARGGSTRDAVQISITTRERTLLKKTVEKNVVKACMEAFEANGYYIPDFLSI